MIIECPSCATRYEFSQEVPEDGLTVRCSKCGHVWRVPSQHDPEGEASIAEASDDVNVAEETARQEDQAASFSETINEAEAHAGQGSDSEVAEPAASNDGMGRLFDRGGEADEPVVPFPSRLAARASGRQDAPGDSTLWFAAFRRGSGKGANGGKASAAEDASTDAQSAAAEAPSEDEQSSSIPEKTFQELQTAEQARAAIRSVFASFAPRQSDPRDDISGDAGHGHEAPLFEQSKGADSFETKAEDPALERTALEDEPRREFSASSLLQGSARAGEPTDGEFAPFQPQAKIDPVREDVDVAAEIADQLESQLKWNVQNTRPPKAPVGPSWGPRRVPGEPEAAESDEAGLPEGEGEYDPRLYREIEESRASPEELARRARRQRLLLGTGWTALAMTFLGVVGFVFGFRDRAVNVFPGLAPIYHSLGLSVIVQPLIIENVNYKWGVADGKTVLTVTGEVFNRAHRKVRVPPLNISVKDKNPELDREFTALLDGPTKIKSGRRMEFEIELSSPSPSVAAVELELRDVN